MHGLKGLSEKRNRGVDKMAKLTVEDLHSLRAREEVKMKKRDIEGRKRHIVVAMGTSGIESGAKIILDEFADQAEKKGLDDVIITQSGVIEGVKEPAIQIHTPSLGLVTYAGIKKSDVEKILDETVMGGKVISDLQVEA